MRIVLEIVQEMIVVLVIAEVLAAVMALPLYWVFEIYNPGPAWIPAGYLEAWAITSTLVLTIVIITWVVDISKGVNI